MRQIVYFSTAAGRRQDAVTLAGILAVSRDLNLRDRISGLLIAGGHRYLQIIEGEAQVVAATMERITRDHRHLAVTVLVDRTIARRCFDIWTMGFCEEPLLGDFATLADMIDHLRSEVRDPHLRAQVDCFARSFVVPSSVPVPVAAPSPWTLASGYDPGLAFDRSH